MRKRGVSALLLLALVCSLAALPGCGEQWQKKFIRKKKSVGPPQPILVLVPDEKALHPPEDRYREHFALWKSWHSELLASLGQIRKRDQRYLIGAVGELRAMRELLTGPPAEDLSGILTELAGLHEAWDRSPEPWRLAPAVRTRLEQIERQVNRRFHYSRVKGTIPPAPAEQTPAK